MSAVEQPKAKFTEPSHAFLHHDRPQIPNRPHTRILSGIVARLHMPHVFRSVSAARV